MAYTYQADVWCDKCAEHIKAELARAGKVPEDIEDESSFDSDDYPKVYWPDNEEADGPQNCASGNCGGGPGVGYGPYGTFLENGLTQDGYKLLKSMLDGHGKTLPTFAQEWANFYQFEYHDNPSFVTDILLDLPSDTIQDRFQSDMEDDGFFKESGWYSPEME